MSEDTTEAKIETNTAPVTAPTGAPSNDDKNIATVTHLGGTVFSFVPGLLVWILKKDENAYLAEEAKEALNFQISVVLAYFVASILAWILIGFFLMWLVWIINIVFCILAAISTSKGETYRYPYSLRLIN